MSSPYRQYYKSTHKDQVKKHLKSHSFIQQESHTNGHNLFQSLINKTKYLLEEDKEEQEGGSSTNTARSRKTPLESEMKSDDNLGSTLIYSQEYSSSRNRVHSSSLKSNGKISLQLITPIEVSVTSPLISPKRI